MKWAILTAVVGLWGVPNVLLLTHYYALRRRVMRLELERALSNKQIIDIAEAAATLKNLIKGQSHE